MIKFSETERADLTRLSVSDAQIRALERSVLPLGKALLTKAPTMDGVRKVLTDLHDHLREARKILTRSKDLAAREALARLDEVSDENFDAMRAAPVVLAKLADIAADALKQLPKTARRYRAADPRPVALIWNALVNNSVPPFNLKLSYGPKSDFRRVVEICYGAMFGDTHENIDRPIKDFVMQKNADTKRSRIAFGVRQNPANK